MRHSPGFARMLRNAGAAELEAMRQRTLAEQRRATEEVAHAASLPKEPERADGYPLPRARGKKRN